MDAQIAAGRGDSESLFYIIMRLSGFSPKPLPSVLSRSGVLAHTAEDIDIDARWLEPFADLFEAEQLDDVGALSTVLATLKLFTFMA